MTKLVHGQLARTARCGGLRRGNDHDPGSFGAAPAFD
jgi:hypothetical protein